MTTLEVPQRVERVETARPLLFASVREPEIQSARELGLVVAALDRQLLAEGLAVARTWNLSMERDAKTMVFTSGKEWHIAQAPTVAAPERAEWTWRRIAGLVFRGSRSMTPEERREFDQMSRANVMPLSKPLKKRSSL